MSGRPTHMDRRTVLRLLAATPVAGLAWTPQDVAAASAKVGRALQDVASGTAFEPAFFTEHEFRTVRLLVDMIIPADDRSGSATDAGVPEFMDFIMTDQPAAQTPMRGGLAWLDVEALERFDARFADCAEGQRRAILDDIAWPEHAPEELSHGVAFFNRFRDLTATGFWSSPMGVEDLQYLGNRYQNSWDGCPDEQLRRLGLID